MKVYRSFFEGYSLVAEKENPCALYAAETLKDYLFKCTGAQTEITGNIPGNGRKFFAIGKKFARELLPFFDYMTLNGDGFRIVPVGDNIIFDALTGRGTIYAVCDFIERVLGVKTLTCFDEYVPKKETYDFPDKEIVSVPDIARRTYLIGPTYDRYTDMDYSVKTRNIGNFIKLDEAHGGVNMVYGRNTVHNFHFYCPFEVYGNEHPEFYRFMYINDEIYPTIDLTNGITDDGRLDESMEVSVAKVVIEELKKDVDEHPETDVFNFTQEDGPYYFDSDRNRAHEKKYKRSGILMRFCNVVIRELNKYVSEKYENREIKLLTFAYSYAKDAPVKYIDGKAVPLDKTVVADENVIIQMAFFSNGCYSYFSEKSPELYAQMREWEVICSKFWFWAYDINFHRYLYFFDSFHTIGDNARGFKKLGVHYLLMHSAHECRNNWQCNMRGYVYNKMMWDSSLCAEDLLSEYAELFYGPAKDSVLNMISHFHEHYKGLIEKGVDLWFISGGSHEKPENNPLNMLLGALEILNGGEKAVKDSDLSAEEKDKYLRRLAQVKCTPLCMIFDNYKAYYPSASEEERIKFGKEFIAVCEYGGVDKDAVGERTSMRYYFNETGLTEGKENFVPFNGWI